MAVRARAEVTLTQIQVDENHFWTDGQGAHVTVSERPAEGEAVTGKNVLVTSSSVQVRDGETVLSEFADDAASIGAGSSTARIDLCAETSAIRGYASGDGAGAIAFRTDYATGAVGMIASGNKPAADIYYDSTSFVGASTGKLIYMNGQYQAGDGTDKPRVVLSGERLYIMGPAKMSDHWDLDMKKTAQTLSNTANTRFYIGSVVKRAAGYYCTAFTPSEYQAITGHAFDINKDFVQATNGDYNANPNTIDGMHLDKSGNIVAHMNDSTTVMLRINYLIACRA